MRSHANPLAEDEAEAWFCHDGPMSGITIQCSKCDELCIVVQGTKDSLCGNLACRKHLVYRPYWEW